MALKLVWRGSSWHVHGTVATPTGEQVRVRKSTGFGKDDKRMAEDVRRRILHEVLSGKWGKVSGEAETLSDAVDLFLNRPTPPGKTDQGILRRLQRALGGRKLKALRGAELMAWVTGRGNAAGTVKREINAINACLAYSRKLGVEIAQFELVKPSVDDERNRWVTAEERDRLLGLCSDTIQNQVAFLFWTGARLGESFALKWADVHLDVDKPFVTLRTRKSRGGKEKKRAVPLRPQVCAVLRQQRQKRGTKIGPKDLVFVNSDGLPWERTPFYKHFDRAVLDAGIEDFHPHDCRHTFASHLIQQGVRERIVAQLLGHSSLALVMRYTHLAPDHMDEAVRALDAVA